MQTLRHALKRPWLRGAILVLLAVVVGWFLGSRVTGRAPAGDDATDQIYRDVAGRIVRLSPDDGMMTVDHEEIEGFMPAMAMDLQVADWRELAAFSPGDDIIFDLVNLDGTIQVVRLRPANRDTSGASPRPDDHGPIDPLGRGDIVPDLELYDASGNRFRLREMEPRHKVITFFYVRCPLQDFCPTQSQRLARLQKHTALSASGVHMVSLTLDADNDGPEVLADYAKRFAADPKLWTLAGGKDSEAIRMFADRAGARIVRDEGGTRIDHALIALRIDGDRIVDFVYGIEAIEALIGAI